MSDEKLDQWGVVDLFGHTRLAGKISEYAFGGDSFVRVDVPSVKGIPEHTRLFGKGAIYSISFTSQEIAEGVARNCESKPVSVYQFDQETQARMRALPVPIDGNGDPDDFDDDDDDISGFEEGQVID